MIDKILRKVSEIKSYLKNLIKEYLADYIEETIVYLEDILYFSYRWILWASVQTVKFILRILIEFVAFRDFLDEMFEPSPAKFIFWFCMLIFLFIVIFLFDCFVRSHFWSNFKYKRSLCWFLFLFFFYLCFILVLMIYHKL